MGRHCIGVDHYYLTYKAESLGYHPQVILAGRRINDNMGMYIANKVIKLMSNAGSPIKDARILVLGITFKENCPDIRNSRVIDVINELQGFGAEIEVIDPEADKDEVIEEYNIQLSPSPHGKYDSIILAVGHDDFKKLNLPDFQADHTVVYDVKGFLNKAQITDRL